MIMILFTELERLWKSKILTKIGGMNVLLVFISLLIGKKQLNIDIERIKQGRTTKDAQGRIFRAPSSRSSYLPDGVQHESIIVRFHSCEYIGKEKT